MSLKETFRYPHPVNEVTARLVAGQVALLGGAILAFDLPWVLPLLVYGFVARVLAGAALSPMAWLAKRSIGSARAFPRPTAGPPKRFAQGLGLVVSGATLAAWPVLGQAEVGRSLLGALVAFATLESALGLCVGCVAFRQLMRWGWIPRETCERCHNLPFPARDAA